MGISPSETNEITLFVNTPTMKKLIVNKLIVNKLTMNKLEEYPFIGNESGATLSWVFSTGILNSAVSLSSIKLKDGEKPTT